MKKTKNLTFCAIMVALSVVILFLCSLTQLLDLTSVLFASVCVFVVGEELKLKRAVAVYLATGILAFLLIPSKLVAIEYFLFGIYPAIKPIIEKTGRAVSFILKGAYIIGATLADVAIIKFFFPQEIEKDWFIILIAVVSVLWLILYDIAYTRLSAYYHGKLRYQLRIDKFFS
ncbi:MAG: hypothetical protein IJW19_07930 [Clostridia bacterium]|nr:hypothetical protein [Clostridia bacterium]